MTFNCCGRDRPGRCIPGAVAAIICPVSNPESPMSHHPYAGLRAGLGVVLSLAFAMLAANPAAPQDSPQRKGKFGPGTASIPKAQITPHWFADDTRFWYRNDLKGGAREFVLVDAEAGKRGPAFDHDKLAAALSKAANTEYKADRLPFDDIEFVDDSKTVRYD